MRRAPRGPESPVTYQAPMLCVAHSSTLGACQLKLNGCPQYDRPQYKSWFTVAAASSSACVHSAESWRRSCGVAGEERPDAVMHRWQDPRPPPPPPRAPPRRRCDQRPRRPPSPSPSLTPLPAVAAAERMCKTNKTQIHVYSDLYTIIYILYIYISKTPTGRVTGAPTILS